MNISDIIEKSVKPILYEKGTSFMWTDVHISKQLLEVHLNPDVDLASRRKMSIQRTVDWILGMQATKDKLKILDLGCGPGLYAEILAKEGHAVTGVDISKNSIEYARKSAKAKNLQVEYKNASYLELEMGGNEYDLILMIYTDFGVLLPYEREILLAKVFQALKPGGKFIFDVLSTKEFESKISPKTWESSKSGFWSNNPYLALSESFLYPAEKVVLYQHLLVTSTNDLEIFRFWTHFFSQDDLKKILVLFGFANIQFEKDVLPSGDKWNGDNVLFCVAGS